MRKRLRKKKHVGEFKEWGCQLRIRRNTAEDQDEFIDSFIEGAIEANGCFCGGGGKGESWEFFVELGRTADDPGGRLERIREWLDSRPDVEDYDAGVLTDAWHGPFQD